jgi:two-component system, NarL family, nitrate/nitrite response regulator NarL
MGRIRIAAFDQIPLFRAGIVQVLNAEPGMEVVAEGSSISEALRLGTEALPDVIILDANLLEAGAVAARSITALRARAKILLLTFRVDEEQAHTAFAAGVQGYVLKGVSGRELLEAVRAVHEGQGYVSPALAAVMMLNQAAAKSATGANSKSLDQLTHREDQIFKLLCTGQTNKEIGARLLLTEKSIKRYVTRIFEVLNVRNRVEAALLARPEGPSRLAYATPGATAQAPMPNEIARVSPAVIGLAPPSASTPAAGSTKGGLAHLEFRKKPAAGARDLTHYALDDSLADAVRITPLTARCFAAVFGHTSSLLPVLDVAKDSGSMPLGTHIVL